MKQYSVYILKSQSSEIYYVGMAMDPEARLIEHNAGKSKFTKGHLPFILIYTEGPFDAQEARKREKFLKKSDNKNRIFSKLK